MIVKPSINNFKMAYQNFPRSYHSDFDCFWNWKNKIESEKDHILDSQNLDRTCQKLLSILKKWQYFRGPKSKEKPHKNLKVALSNISDEYAIIRNLTLLEIEKFPYESFHIIWQELGNMKTLADEASSQQPLVISICKPLMLIWGQTLAFDTKVRNNFTRDQDIRKLNKYRWSLNEWFYSLYLCNKLLNENEEFKYYLTNCSVKKYRKKGPVPFGRLLDIYYFTPGKEASLKKCGIRSDNSPSNDSSGIV
ncbi:hypothetical protein [Methanoregula sp.]|uniref:hypothetical protein n=1 Tax=Methanoregula sp. TaxID=2052170 RepID=UPI002B9085B2|nr:hypothetical protein [Methanoregula sp.]HVP96760.1 hypothetical protein [Methanoregula sp.]